MKLFGIAVFSLAAALGAAELDVNGTFKPGTGGVPAGYRLTTDKSRIGKAEIQSGTVRLVSEKGTVSLIFTKKFPVVPGEKYVLEAQLKGTGYAGAGLQYMDAKGNYLRGDYAQAVNCSKQGTVRREITIPEQEGRRRKAVPGQVCFLIFVHEKGDAVFSSFKVDKK